MISSAQPNRLIRSPLAPSFARRMFAGLSDIQAFWAFTLTFLMVFVNSADFQGANPEAFEFKSQIYLRLLICSLAGIFGLIHLDVTVRKYLTFPAALFPLYALVATLTLPFSIDKFYSLVALTCLWTLVFFLPAALARLGSDRFLVALTLGAVSYVLASWVLYLAYPEVGTWKEFIDSDTWLERMGGLGHPNTLGVYASSALLLLLIGARRRLVSVTLVLAWVVIWAATSYYCLSRTAVLVAMIGVVAIFWDKLRSWTALAMALIAIVAAGLGLVALESSGQLDWAIHDLFKSFSKSGDVSELTSATGRSEIWSYAVQKIGEQPALGYGYGTQRFVMVDHSYHCHNIVLNATLANGLIAGGLILAMCLVLARRWLNSSDYFMIAFAPLFLIGGAVESMIYSPAPSLEMLIFFALVMWEPHDPGSLDDLEAWPVEQDNVGQTGR